jgi:putative MATE family efflux protein
MKQRKNLTEGSVSKAIIGMTLPMIVGMFSIVAFNLVDTWFIAKLGTTALAAMSFTLPVVMLQGAISMGLGIGASAVISQAIGKNDSTTMKQLTTSALFLSVILVIVVVTLGLLTINPLFRLLGASEELLPLIKEYMSVWYIGVPFVVIPMVGNNAIRATGNTTIPSVIMLASVLINIVLDPLFIFGVGIFPEWGLKGAAVATVIARMGTLVVSLSFLRFKFDMLTTKFDSFKVMWNGWKQILYIAVPAALTQILMPLSMGFLTKLVAGYGENAVAALGVANRIEFFALAPLMALGSVVIPFIGQNLGAKKYDRIIEGYKFSMKFSLGLGVMVLLVFFLFKTGLAQIFTSKPEVISIVGLYLSIVSIGYGFQGITAISSSSFSALNKPLNAAGVNLLRLVVFFVPFALVGSHIWGLTGIFGAIAAASILAGAIAQVWVKRTVVTLKL